MISRQPKIHVAFRISAAVTVVFWLLAASYCSVEHLFGFDHHGTATASEENAHHEATANLGHAHADATEHSYGKDHHSHDAELPHPSQDAEGHSHGSHHHDDGGSSCCSTLQGAVYVGQPIIISAPVVHPHSLLYALLQAHASAFIALVKPPDHPPPNHDWVFTPEVCNGPANRPHGPPASA